MTLTAGILASQYKTGPYTLSYIGYANSPGATTTLTQSFNLGTEYSDRLVFVGVVQANPNSSQATSVTANSISGTRVGGISNTGLTEWWYVHCPIGTTSVPITVTLPISNYTAFMVYTLGGGALGGKTPTLQVSTGYANNSNSVAATFASITANDLFMANAIKVDGGSTSLTNFTSNMSPLTVNISGVGVSNTNDGFGACRVGPVSVVSSPNIVAVGADSSKPIQIAALRVRKAV